VLRRRGDVGVEGLVEEENSHVWNLSRNAWTVRYGFR
jgi:hypothetical protein